MNVIYMISLEITFILLNLYLLPKNIAIFISVLTIILLTIFNNKNKIFIAIIPILFLIRSVYTIDFSNHLIGNTVTLNMQLYKEKGLIKEINGKFPTSISYTYITNLQNGLYNITGTIKNKAIKYNNTYYTLDIDNIKEIQENTLKLYFKNKANSLLKNSNFQLKKIYYAVVLGENQYLNKQLKNIFSYIGISHLMALSGFHIGLIILIVNFIISKFSLTKRKKNILLLLFITCYYMGITHSPSLTRAYIMGVIYLLGNILYENTTLPKSLCIAYIISLFFNPTYIQNISFKLSYIAVFIIAYIYPIIKSMLNSKNKIIHSFIFIITIQIFLLPVTLNEFGTIQILGFISNLIAVPIGSIFITISFIGLLLENIYLGFVVYPLIKISYLIFIKTINILNKIPLMTLKINNGFKSSLFYILYIGILCFLAFYMERKKEKITHEKIYKRTHIHQ